MIPPALNRYETRLWSSYGDDGPPEGHAIRRLLVTISDDRVRARTWFLRMFAAYAMSAVTLAVGCYTLGGR